MKPGSGLDRAEQAREAAGQFTDPSARKAVLELAEGFDRIARAAATPAVLRRSELARERLGTKLVISPVRSSVKQAPGPLSSRWDLATARPPSALARRDRAHSQASFKVDNILVLLHRFSQLLLSA